MLAITSVAWNVLWGSFVQSQGMFCEHPCILYGPAWFCHMCCWACPPAHMCFVGPYQGVTSSPSAHVAQPHFVLGFHGYDVCSSQGGRFTAAGGFHERNERFCRPSGCVNALAALEVSSRMSHPLRSCEILCEFSIREVHDVVPAALTLYTLLGINWLPVTLMHDDAVVPGTCAQPSCPSPVA